MDEAEKVCAFEGCSARVDEEDYCTGCKAYTCDRHSTNYEIPFKDHDAALHWSPAPSQVSQR